MADRKFLIVSADFRRSPDMELFQGQLDKAVDWMQFLPGQWILWTARSASKWYARLKPFLKDGDHILVYEINVEERAGRMPSAFWEFIRQKLSQ